MEAGWNEKGLGVDTEGYTHYEEHHVTLFGGRCMY